MNRRRMLHAACASAAMIATSAATPLLTPRAYLAGAQQPVQLDRWISTKFAGWEVDSRNEIVLPSPDLQERLDKLYSDVLARSYLHSSGEQVMLSIAYGSDQSDATATHRPEICYAAQGFEIRDRQVGSLELRDQTIPVSRLVAVLGDRSEPLTYWMIVGGHVVATGTDLKVAQLRYGFRGLIPDGFIFRVSSLNLDVHQAFAIQARFVADLFQAMSPVYGRKLSGSESLSGA